MDPIQELVLKVGFGITRKCYLVDKETMRFEFADGSIYELATDRNNKLYADLKKEGFLNDKDIR